MFVCLFVVVAAVVVAAVSGVVVSDSVSVSAPRCYLWMFDVVVVVLCVVVS